MSEKKKRDHVGELIKAAKKVVSVHEKGGLGRGGQSILMNELAQAIEAMPGRGPQTLVYLATPYSHPDPLVRVFRFNAVNRAAAQLMAKGLHIYSPISHTHPIAMEGSLPLGWDFWQQYDRAILDACCRMIVLRLPGWEESKGVAAEMQIAQDLGLAVSFIDPDSIDQERPAQ